MRRSRSSNSSSSSVTPREVRAEAAVITCRKTRTARNEAAEPVPTAEEEGEEVKEMLLHMHGCHNQNELSNIPCVEERERNRQRFLSCVYA